VQNSTPLAVASNTLHHTDSRDPRSTGVQYISPKPLFPDPAEQIQLTGPQIAAKFIANMFGLTTAAPVHICRFPNDDSEALPFRKIDTRDPAAIESFVKRYDEPGSAVYYCVGTLKEGATARNKPNVAEISMLHADIDFKHIDDTRADVERKLKNLKYPPSLMVFSGNGIHAYPPKAGAAPADDRNRVIPFPKPAAPPIEIFWHGKSYERANRPWLIENLIPETGQGLASGQWGAGKTFAGIDLGASVMTGTPFAGREVGRRGGVVFIAAEGASEIPIRLEGVVNHKLRPNSSIAADLDNLPFAWIEECPSLKDETGFERLVAIVLDAAAQMKERFNVDLALIVIDTLSA
jgi:AAA domain